MADRDDEPEVSAAAKTDDPSPNAAIDGEGVDASDAAEDEAVSEAAADQAKAPVDSSDAAEDEAASVDVSEAAADEATAAVDSGDAADDEAEAGAVSNDGANDEAAVDLAAAKPAAARESSVFARTFGVVAFVAALGGGFLIGQYIQRDNTPFAGYADETRYQVQLRGDEPQLGPDDALVTIIEFSDYECPYCQRADGPLHDAVEDNDDVRVIFKHYPLPMHANAIPAARAAWAAQQQGKFWEMHEHLFEAGGKLDDIEKAAREMGLDVGRFTQDMLSEAAKAALESDRHAAGLLGIGSTPHFVINGRHVRGALADSHWDKVIEREREDAEAILDQGVARADLYGHLMQSAKAKRKAPSRGPDPQKRHAVRPGDGRPSLGPADALVTVVEFSDFQCPFCARLAPTVHGLTERHGDVRVVFRQMPLPNHSVARPAAKAALAAQRQGKFWEMHDALFQAEGKIEADDIEELAQSIGLDMDRFAADRADPAIEQMIAQDEALAREVGVRGTPASFVNGRFVGGAQPAQSFDAVIEQERKVAQALIDQGTAASDVLEAVFEQPLGGA